jgi:hypothetical protein
MNIKGEGKNEHVDGYSNETYLGVVIVTVSPWTFRQAFL